MNNADVNFNKITDLINTNNEIENKKFATNKALETEKEAISSYSIQGEENLNQEKTGVKTFQNISQNLEKLFTPDEKKELDRRFLLYSSDGIMSNRQFWNFLDLGQIANTTFAKLFYKAVCDFNDNTKLDHLKFMDKYKFYQFVAVFTKTSVLNENESYFIEGVNKNDTNSNFSRDVKLKFLNTLFDVDNNEEVDRLEFRNLISSFIEMILSCKFECAPIQEQINNILNIDTSGGTNNISQLMEKVLDLYVDEVFARSYTGETLTFDEWKKWLFDEVAGIQEILDYSTTIVANAIEK